MAILNDCNVFLVLKRSAIDSVAVYSAKSTDSTLILRIIHYLIQKFNISVSIDTVQSNQCAIYIFASLWYIRQFCFVQSCKKQVHVHVLMCLVCVLQTVRFVLFQSGFSDFDRDINYF